MFPIDFPGQVAWVHSPCYSQEIEAIAFGAAEDLDTFDGASGQIASMIQKLSGTPFRDAGGKENDWAARMMGATVPMNDENMAATIKGTGFPKLVVLTFWNDPSNPAEGGVNYGYFIEIKFPKELVDEGGGFIFMGNQRGIDPGRISKEVVAINTWMSTVLEMLQRMQTVRPDWPKKHPKEMAEMLKLLLEKFKEGQEAHKAVRSIMEGIDEKEKANQVQEEKYVEIEGVRYERTKTYSFTFKIQGQQITGHMTPATFMKKYGTMDYKILSINTISH